MVGVAIVVRAQSSTSLQLIFDTARVLNPAIRANVIAEAARIWSPYDIALDLKDDVQCDPPGVPPVTVTIDAGHGTTSGDAGLGAIRFGTDGTPESTIVLNYDAVVRIATSSPVMGLHPAFWPMGLRDEIVARALGRALAHELGHFLLRSPHHTESGLMRARHQGSSLASPSRRLFGLTGPDRARLHAILGAPLLASVASSGVAGICPVIATR
jgi:hypothetical protein